PGHRLESTLKAGLGDPELPRERRQWRRIRVCHAQDRSRAPDLVAAWLIQVERIMVGKVATVLQYLQPNAQPLVEFRRHPLAQPAPPYRQMEAGPDRVAVNALQEKNPLARLLMLAVEDLHKPVGVRVFRLSHAFKQVRQRRVYCDVPNLDAGLRYPVCVFGPGNGRYQQRRAEVMNVLAFAQELRPLDRRDELEGDEVGHLVADHEL